MIARTLSVRRRLERSMSIEIQPFYDPATFTLTYVVFDPKSRDAIAIDPVLDLDPFARDGRGLPAEARAPLALGARDPRACRSPERLAIPPPSLRCADCHRPGDH